METKINGELTQFEQLVIDANDNQLITALMVRNVDYFIECMFRKWG